MTMTLKHAAATAFAVGALFVGSTSVSAQSGRSEPTSPYAEGKSVPSRIAKLHAQVPGLVKQVLVKRGDRVKEGQPLLQQDDRLAVNQLEIAEKEANSDIRVEAAKSDLAQKQVELKRIEQNSGNNTFSPIELERAQLEVVFKGHQLSLSHLELAKAKLEAVGARLRVEFMKLAAPFDGVVESIDTEVGEMLDPQRQPFMTIVSNDPVKIIVQLTAPQAAKLKKGDTLDVRYKIDAADAWQQATVESLAAVATAGAGFESQREVHLTMPNPNNRESGLWLWVKLPEATETAGTAAATPAQ
ncbi:MAG TPA: efflux RND transporter periplasmic adaptor subunit [Tepidisphaeraceae bacterium]|nr:efflux RND transporter periplasmic adaptor subunit [Tepidisphaeraceae bacterium]